jgi:hypothetical protein
MPLTGKVDEDGWSVRVETKPAPDGKFCSDIHVCHRTRDGKFAHVFANQECFSTEREAMLAGLREGMIWIELKRSRTFHVEASGTDGTDLRSSE